jgi:serine/threonine-protein kinase
LGVILFELLAGRPAFESPSLAMLMAAILHEPAPDLRELRPDVPAELANVVARCLVKDREQRLQSVTELAVALLPFAPHRSYWNIERLSKSSGLQPVTSAARQSGAVSNSAVSNNADSNSAVSAAVSTGAASSSALSNAGSLEKPVQSGSTLVAGGRNDVTASPWVGEGTQTGGAKPAPQRRATLIVGVAALGAAALGAVLLVRASGESETPSTASGSAAEQSQATAPLPAPAQVASTSPQLPRTVMVEPLPPGDAVNTELGAPDLASSTEPAPTPTTSSAAPGSTASSRTPTKPGKSSGNSRPSPSPVASQPVAPEPRNKPPKPPKPENPLEMDLK